MKSTIVGIYGIRTDNSNENNLLLLIDGVDNKSRLLAGDVVLLNGSLIA